MPSYVDPSKCDGCKGGDKTACMYICPNDLMVLNVETMLAYNQEPDACAGSVIPALRFARRTPFLFVAMTTLCQWVVRFTQ